jgi:hypothetical protein
MNKCLCCGSDFTPARSFGQPQVYCSKKCANRVRNERVKQRIIENALYEKEQQGVLVADVGQSELGVVGKKEQPGFNYGRGPGVSNEQRGGVVPAFIIEHLEKVYDQKFQSQVTAYHFEQQIKAMQQNNELLAARLKEWEDGDEDDGDEQPSGWIAGVERLLENDKFMGLAQMGLLALQGKKVTG